MKKDHRGMSMIELIIVMAIIAIISTGSIAIYSSMGYANTMKAAKLINSKLSKARMDTMSKNQRIYIYLYQIDGKLYSRQAIDGGLSLDHGGGLDSDEASLLSNISLSYIDHSGVIHKLEDNQWIYISFIKGSGAFDSYYSKLIFKSRNSSSTITCIKETGRHWVD